MAWKDRYKYLGVKTGANYLPDLEKLGGGGGGGEIPIEDVSNHYKTKLAAPQDLDLSIPPPFHLWPLVDTV